MEAVTIVRNAECGVQSFHSALLGAVFGVFLCPLFAFGAQAWQWTDGQRVQAQVKEGSGLWLIDVRSAAVYAAVHIEGSVNIPSDVLMHKKFPAQKTLILVDDALGQKTAREAADTLVKKGHERVSVLEGGIPAWKIEGLPLVESKEQVRGVTAAELEWALANAVPMKIYDLRDNTAHHQSNPPLEGKGIKGAQKYEAVSGKTLAERVEKLKTMLAGGGKKKDLATRIKKPQPVVLIFAAADDAEGHTRMILQGAKGDVRYLIGGYEATIADTLRKQQTTGSCPTCPGKGK